MFSKFYQAELAYLRDMGRQFSLAQPAVAPLLAEQSGDPDVERLLEGFAFLTARIRERIDDAVPELSHELIQLLLPHYLRPLPSCSVVEFSAPPHALREAVRIPRGTGLTSRPVEGTACLFRTAADVDLLPLVLLKALATRTTAKNAEIRLQFEVTEGGRAMALATPIALYLHGDLPTATLIFMALMRHCRGITLRDRHGAPRFQLPPEALVATGFQDGSDLVPWPPLVASGFARVQEYFALPQKFLFVEVRGLDRAPPLEEDFFELAFSLADMPTLPPTLGVEHFRLSCAPVVNLFATSADPLRQASPGQEHLLRAAAMNPQHAEVFSVERVIGVRPGKRTEYAPFSLFSHVGASREAAFFQLRRSESPVDAGTDCALVLGSPLEAAPEVGEEVLSVDMTCTNRHLAGHLSLGDICAGQDQLPVRATVKNISPVTQPVPPPLGKEQHWRLLSHLSVTQRTLADEQALRGLLELYNLQVFGDVGQARGNSGRIEAIRQVQVGPTRRLYRGVPVQGSRVRLELQEKAFGSLGDLYLFGCVLDALFASFVTMNAFSELAVKTLPSQYEFVWPIRIGTKQLL